MWKRIERVNHLDVGKEYSIMDRFRFVGNAFFVKDNVFRTKHDQRIQAYAVWEKEKKI